MTQYFQIAFTTPQHNEIHSFNDSQLLVQRIEFLTQEKEDTNIDSIELVVPNFENIVKVIEGREPLRYQPAEDAVDKRTQIEFGYRYQSMNKMWKELKLIAQQYNKAQLDVLGRKLPDLSVQTQKAEGVSLATNKVLVYLKEQWQGYDYVNDPEAQNQETTTDFQVYIDVVRQVKTLQFFKQLSEEQQIQLLLKEFNFYKDLVLKFKFTKYMPQEDYGARNLKLINQNFQSQLKLDAVEKERKKQKKQTDKATQKLNKRNKQIEVQNQLLNNRIKYNQTFGQRVALKGPSNQISPEQFDQYGMEVEQQSKYIQKRAEEKVESDFNQIFDTLGFVNAQFVDFEVSYRKQLSEIFDQTITNKIRQQQQLQDSDYESFEQQQSRIIQGLANQLNIENQQLQNAIGITKEQIQIYLNEQRKKLKPN